MRILLSKIEKLPFCVIQLCMIGGTDFNIVFSFLFSFISFGEIEIWKIQSRQSATYTKNWSVLATQISHLFLFFSISSCFVLPTPRARFIVRCIAMYALKLSSKINTQHWQFSISRRLTQRNKMCFTCTKLFKPHYSQNTERNVLFSLFRCKTTTKKYEKLSQAKPMWCKMVLLT